MTTAKLKVTVLGCGTSSGVPRLGPDWGACDPKDPKNRRRRASILVERISDHGSTVVLVDVGPDLREQMLDAEVARLDAVLITHPHADHIHGIDDLRGFYQRQRHPIPVYMNAVTNARVLEAFRYCFDQAEHSNYPAIAEARPLVEYQPLVIDGPGGPMRVTPFPQHHGQTQSLGFRFGDFVYSSDVSGFEDAALQTIDGVKIWIIDALRHQPHPSHFSIAQALSCVSRLKPEQTYFTHMDNTVDYATVMQDLPDAVALAYDGLTFEVKVTQF